jgi:hypothetical protein
LKAFKPNQQRPKYKPQRGGLSIARSARAGVIWVNGYGLWGNAVGSRFQEGVLKAEGLMLKVEGF